MENFNNKLRISFFFQNFDEPEIFHKWFYSSSVLLNVWFKNQVYAQDLTFSFNSCSILLQPLNRKKWPVK